MKDWGKSQCNKWEVFLPCLFLLEPCFGFQRNPFIHVGVQENDSLPTPSFSWQRVALNADSQLIKALVMSAWPVFSPKPNTDITCFKTQGTSPWKRRQKERKSRGMRKSAMKCHRLDRTWPSQLWIHSGYGGLHQSSTQCWNTHVLVNTPTHAHESNFNSVQ